MYQENSGLALSAQQKHALNINENEGVNNNQSNIQFCMGISGSLDYDRLQAAFEQVVLTHEVLRTAYRLETGLRYPYQYVLEESAQFEWTYKDLSQNNEARKSLKRLQQQQYEQTFELTSGQVCRLAVGKLGENHFELIITLSSIVADQYTIEQLFTSLVRAYDGKQSDLPDSEEITQYTQFSHWLSELQQESEAAESLAYWQGLGDTSFAPLALPYRLNPSAGGLNTKLNVTQKLTGNGWQALTSLAAQRDIDLATLIGASWTSLLYRISGQEKYQIAWHHDCRRDYEELEDSLGLFAKSLPVTVPLDHQTPFSAWVSKLENQLGYHLEAQEYWQADQNELSSYKAAAFEYTQSPDEQSLDQLKFSLRQRTVSLDEAEIKLTVRESNSGLELIMSYQLGCYTNESVERLLAQLVTLLEDVSNSYELPIGDLALVSEQESNKLLAWQGASLELGQVPVYRDIEKHAVTSPEALALVCSEQTYTYSELDKKANRLANILVGQGISAGETVAILLPRCPESIIAILAIWKAGACYLPLDTEWPLSRIDTVLKDANAPAMVTLSSISSADIRVRIDLDTLSKEPGDENGPNVSVDLHQPAYLLYTSGSTGTPKGVLVEHGQLLNYVRGIGKTLALKSGRQFALSSTLAADLGNTLLFHALVNGQTLNVLSLQQATDANAFAEYMVQHAVDTIKLVPSHLEALLTAAKPVQVLPTQTLILGGEATPASLLKRIRALSPDLAIYNHYGPTETTVGVLVHALPASDAVCSDTLPLTTVLPNNQVYILNENQKLAATGEKGELYIAGDNVARGYLNNLDANETRFLFLPDLAQGKVYRTGDLARYRPEGGISLIGRADHQVKIRGFRLELGDVESAILKLHQVKQAVVMPYGDGTSRQLAAYVVPSHPEDFDAKQLSQQLALELPDYMVPARLFNQEFLPLLASGKVDRANLPDPETLPLSHRDNLVMPENEIEEIIAAIWQELLGVEQVGVTWDFFEIGGHSLMAIKVISRARKLLQVELPPGILFEYSQVRSLANAAVKYEASPGKLLAVAKLRKKLSGMSPVQRAALKVQ